MRFLKSVTEVYHIIGKSVCHNMAEEILFSHLFRCIQLPLRELFLCLDGLTGGKIFYPMYI